MARCAFDWWRMRMWIRHWRARIGLHSAKRERESSDLAHAVGRDRTHANSAPQGGIAAQPGFSVPGVDTRLCRVSLLGRGSWDTCVAERSHAHLENHNSTPPTRSITHPGIAAFMCLRAHTCTTVDTASARAPPGRPAERRPRPDPETRAEPQRRKHAHMRDPRRSI